jgi:capsid protein
MVLTAASTDRILGSWGLDAGDPRDQWWTSGDIPAYRGQWLYDNDPIARAIVETIIGGSIGPQGLTFRSQYRQDDDGTTSPAELKMRRKINRRVDLATRHTRFDAAGVLTRPEMSKVTLANKIMHGMSVSIRGWRPNRPGRQTHATCWRIIHPLRVSNPSFRPDSATLNSGFELDASGSPIAIHVMASHPASVRPEYVWKRVPMYAPDGSLNVTIDAVHRHADQIRPMGWFTPVIQLMRLMGRTIEAKVVADTLKSSMGLIWEVDNPTAAAAADRNGAVLTSTTKIVPGKIYYVKRGDKVTPLNFDYKGEDLQKWLEVIVTNICAPFRVPMEFVMQKLTQSNMASSRVALMQAYGTFHSNQNDQILATENPWNHSIILEDLARGTFGIEIKSDADAEEFDRILEGTYQRPPRQMPDPLKEAQGADVQVKRLGRSLTGVYADMGLDLEDEARQREQDDALLEQHGVVLLGDGSPKGGAQGQQPAEDDGDEAKGNAEPASAGAAS